MAIVDPANKASIRVLEKIAMHPTGKASYFGRDWLLFIAARPQAFLELPGWTRTNNPSS